MNEKQFNSLVVRSLKHFGAWAYKIPDSPASYGTGVTRFTPAKPCDIIGIHRGRGFLIEGKMLKGKTFNMKQLRPAQVQALTEVDAQGYIFVYDYKPRQHKRIYVLEACIWLGAASVKFDGILDYIDMKDNIFDLRPFLDSL